MTRLALLLMRALQGLPLPALRRLGALLGALLYRFAHERRHVADTNLRLCFAEPDPARRAPLVRAAFRCFAQAFLDRAIFWYGDPARIRALVHVAGMAHLEALRGRPVILLAPHFVGLDAGGSRLTLFDWRFASIYAHQKDPVFDAALLAGRARFGDPVLISRQDGMRAVLRALKAGHPLYYLPDMDLGPRDAVFAPFFGVPAATVTALSRLARLTGARVLPAVTRMTEAGYEMTIHPPWEDFPGTSEEEDARRLNAFIEGEVRANPAQYHWLHKRFKTRPPGVPRLY